MLVSGRHHIELIHIAGARRLLPERAICDECWDSLPPWAQDMLEDRVDTEAVNGELCLGCWEQDKIRIGIGLGNGRWYDLEDTRIVDADTGEQVEVLDPDESNDILVRWVHRRGPVPWQGRYVTFAPATWAE